MSRLPASIRASTVVVLLALALGFSLRATGAPLCSVVAEIEPAVAFVGQQVVHRTTVEWRGDVDWLEWVAAPTFPDHRVERMGASAETTRIDEAGTTWRRRIEQRALFAATAGRLATPPAELHCAVDEQGVRTVARLPALEVEVRALPDAGRPSGFSGLVGPIKAARLAHAEAIVAGEPVKVSLQMRGPGNVWVADPAAPNGQHAESAFDVFAGPVREQTTRTQSGVVTRRSFDYTLVPRVAGRIALPAESIVWFDPDSGQYTETIVPAVEVIVAEPSAVADAGPSSEAATPPANDGGPGTLGLIARTAAVTMVVGGVFAALAWGLFRARTARRPLHDALEAAEQARLAGRPRREAEALERALRATLAQRSPALAGLSAPSLAFRGEGDDTLTEAADLLAQLERSRYASDGEPPDRDAVRQFIAENTRET